MVRFALRSLSKSLFTGLIRKSELLSFANYNSRIIKSFIPNIEIPNATVPQFVFQNFCKFPHKTAVVCGVTGRKYTFEQLRSEAVNFGNNLRFRLKLNKGDVVAIFMPNLPEFAVAILGVLEGSMVVTTINPFHNAEEIKAQLVDSRAKAIVTTCALYQFARTTVLPLIDIHIITIKSEINDTTPPNAIDFEELTKKRSSFSLNEYIDPQDAAVILYSSGTTGVPKAIVQTHFNLVANLCQLNSLHTIQETTENHQDVLPAVIQLSHMYGLNMLLLYGLSNISKIVTVPKFKPGTFLNMFELHKPTVFYCAPPLILFMTDHGSFNRRHFENLQVVVSAAAPLSNSDINSFLEKTEKSVAFCQGYGTSETGLLLYNDHIDKPYGSLGTPISNVTIKVISMNNCEMLQPSYTNGELLVKGPQVMKEHHNIGVEHSFTNGWLRTGDVVYYDNKNNVFLVDRLKEFIKVKGYQVAPAELEQILCNYPNIEDAAVIGIPHKQYGEVPRAYITVKPHSKVDIKEVEKYIAHKVASYKYITGGIAIIDNLPKSGSGKLLRKKLKMMYLNES
ncbi:hypothetical protein FQA39_LY01945 [Lamprigera yunnana]|nr:hypothetical protein FQA39_LY01945 [Lamprigera yunnana]